MNRSFPLVSGALSLVFTLSANASLLGPADGYNAFVFGNYNSSASSDAEGRVAVQGDLSVDNYSFGAEAAPGAYTAVVGGDVSINSGTVANGGIHAGGNVNISNLTVNGDVDAGGSISFNDGHVYGDARAVGGISVGSGGTIHGSLGSVPTASPVDFAASYAYLTGLSDQLAGMATNGGADINMYSGAVTLTGGEGVNVFSLTIEELYGASSGGFTFSGLDADDIAIVNVTGDALGTAQNFAFNMGDLSVDNLLFNVVDASSLNIQNVGWRGTILAPDTDITMNSMHINGSVIGASFSGSGQLNWHPVDFDLEVPTSDVPAPATWWLFGAGMVMLGALGRRRVFV